jgi:hypothetical protein
VKVLFDQGTPAPLRRALLDHVVETAFERGWASLRNGELLAAAESAGFDVFVTTDRNLKYQQNLEGRELSIVVLLGASWPRIQAVLPAVVRAIDDAQQGGYTEVKLEIRPPDA